MRLLLDALRATAAARPDSCALVAADTTRTFVTSWMHRRASRARYSRPRSSPAIVSASFCPTRPSSLWPTTECWPQVPWPFR
jgi:hypothetical protein